MPGHNRDRSSAPGQSERFATPDSRKEIESDKSAFPALGRRDYRFNLIRIEWHHLGIVRLIRQFRIVVIRLPRILEWLHPEQEVFAE